MYQQHEGDKGLAGRRLQLANCLALNPLDRLQINSDRERREQRSWSRLHNDQTNLPFWFFQFVGPDGLLYVRSPSGYATRVDPLDVCDVIRAEPIEVMAMPAARFLEWNRLPYNRRAQQDPAQYAPAHVVAVCKDRWGRVDSAYVRFLDAALNRPNEGASATAPLWDVDRARLDALARRTRMPVISPAGTGNYSADQGVLQVETRVRGDVRRFIQASIARNEKALSKLCNAGVATP